MNGRAKMVTIETVPTGVPGLDSVLGGGLPELSFNLVTGEPGSGKTTLVHQILFANATKETPVLYLTVMGEPPLKMLRYQQQFDFFDMDKVGKTVHFRTLSEEADTGDLDLLLERISRELSKVRPAFVSVDSFRTLVRTRFRPDAEGRADFQAFMQRLALELTRWEATTFLVGEFPEAERMVNPVFTVADGILWLRQAREGNQIYRKLQVLKMRGRAHLSGLHRFEITRAGIRVFPLDRDPPVIEITRNPGEERRSTGIPGLDRLMGGGIPTGDSAILSGPTGSGKSTVGMHFVQAGLENGEAAVILAFGASEGQYDDRARELGLDLGKAKGADRVRMVVRRPLDLSGDETFEAIREAVEAVREIGASRVVIDSLTGLETAVPADKTADVRAAVARAVGALTRGGVTVLATDDLDQSAGESSPALPHASFLSDVVVLQRYQEMDGELEKAIAVVKMRSSEHSRAFHRYRITGAGIVVERALNEGPAPAKGLPEGGETR